MPPCGNFVSDVYHEVYIDNVRFIGSEAAVKAAAVTFVERCARAGVTLNDIDVTKTSRCTVAASMVRQSGDWLGEAYDFCRKTLALTEKTREKILAVWAERGTWTWRVFGRSISLLFYASRTLGVQLSPFFAALRAFREASRLLSDAPKRWDDAARVDPCAMRALSSWVEAVLTSGPRRIVDALTLPKWVMATDASAWGWGALVLGPNGELLSHAHTWTAQDVDRGLNCGTSTHAEPEAIYRAMCKTLVPGDEAAVEIWTDNMAAKYALAKGYSPAWYVNVVCERIRRTFPNVMLTLKHVPGVQNPADGVSRGRQAEVADWANWSGLLARGPST
jgi:hypothetical protein